MGCKTDERPSRSCLLQWLTISGRCVQGLIEQRYFSLTVPGQKWKQRLKDAGPSVPMFLHPVWSHIGQRWRWDRSISVGVRWTCVASPACFSPSSFSFFTSTLAISSALQDSSLFFPCLAFLPAAKLCWFPRVSPALIVCFCPSSTFISFGSSSPFFHYFKLVRDVVSLDFGFMVFCFFPPPPHCCFFTTIKINHFDSFL